MESDKNYINLDCSKMNANATIRLAAKIVDVLIEKGEGYESMVKMTVKADKE